MNFRGIELLRNFGLPGPIGEQLFLLKDKPKVSLLYNQVKLGTAILVGKEQKITDHPWHDNSVRKYHIQENAFDQEMASLVKEMETKGIPASSIAVIFHQTYTMQDISYSGRISILSAFDQDLWVLEGVRGLRTGQKEFTPEFRYVAQIYRGRVRSLETRLRAPDNMDKLVRKALRSTIILPGQPHIDFEVYANNSKLFYHDMFMEE